jgi:hypothetical protein
MAQNGFSDFSHFRADFFDPQNTGMTPKQGPNFLYSFAALLRGGTFWFIVHTFKFYFDYGTKGGFCTGHDDHFFKKTKPL